MPYLVKGTRPDINNGQGVTQIEPTFWPSPGHSNLGSDGRYTCSSLPLIVWWVPYLDKGCRPDFNNGPSPGHSNRVSDEVYIYSVLLLMVSWWLLYQAKGPMPDFNSGPGNDSNIGCTLAVQRLFESSLSNSPSPSHSNLASEYISVQVSYL